jgi:hypothetical protein
MAKPSTADDHEITLRLANIEALLHQLFDRRRAKTARAGTRKRSLAERLKAASLAKEKQPAERHFAIAREMMTFKR